MSENDLLRNIDRPDGVVARLERLEAMVESLQRSGPAKDPTTGGIVLGSDKEPVVMEGKVVIKQTIVEDSGDGNDTPIPPFNNFNQMLMTNTSSYDPTQLNVDTHTLVGRGSGAILDTPVGENAVAGRAGSGTVAGIDIGTYEMLGRIGTANLGAMTTAQLQLQAGIIGGVSSMSDPSNGTQESGHVKTHSGATINLTNSDPLFCQYYYDGAVTFNLPAGSPDCKVWICCRTNTLSVDQVTFSPAAGDFIGEKAAGVDLVVSASLDKDGFILVSSYPPTGHSGYHVNKWSIIGMPG